VWPVLVWSAPPPLQYGSQREAAEASDALGGALTAWIPATLAASCPVTLVMYRHQGRVAFTLGGGAGANRTVYTCSALTPVAQACARPVCTLVRAPSL
jgi:hypothetical protein